MPSTRHQRSGMTCLVLVYLLCCCGACLRRSLRCHTCAFIHLERFDGCLVLESPRAGCAGSLSAHHRNGLICVLLPCLLRVLQTEAGAPPLFATATEGRPGKVLTLTLRSVPHPSLLRQQRAGPTKDPEVGRPNPLCYRNRGQA